MKSIFECQQQLPSGACLAHSSGATHSLSLSLPPAGLTPGGISSHCDNLAPYKTQLAGERSNLQESAPKQGCSCSAKYLAEAPLQPREPC